jgi:formate dehydrogenase maturation protein FdhE
MQCPYCDNTDGKKLSFMTSDDGLYRLICASSARAISKHRSQKSHGDVVMAVESLTTVAMDAQAQEKGYHRGA